MDNLDQHGSVHELRCDYFRKCIYTEREHAHKCAAVWAGGAFCGDMMYCGDGGKLLESLWSLDCVTLLVDQPQHDMRACSTDNDDERARADDRTATNSCVGGCRHGTSGGRKAVSPPAATSKTSDTLVAGKLPDVLPWKPLRRCDGRYSLGRQWADCLRTVSPLAIAHVVVSSSLPVTASFSASSEESCSSAAMPQPKGAEFVMMDLVRCAQPMAAAKQSDPMVVVRFSGGGGLLSYVKPDEHFVHTFNTESGLCRKVSVAKQRSVDVQFHSR